MLQQKSSNLKRQRSNYYRLFLMYGICHQNFKNMSNSVSNKKFFKLKERPTTMSTKFKNILHNDTVLQNQKKVQLGIAS